MRRIVILLVVVLGVGVVGDLGARTWAEGQIKTRIESAVPASVHVDSHIHAFPFLLPLLTGGRVAEVDGEFKNVAAGPLIVDTLSIELHGVRVDRNVLLHDHKVRLRSIRDGVVSADITAAELTRVLHVPVTIANGAVEVTVAGVTVDTHVSVRSNALVFGVAGIPRLAIPKTNLLPCATGITVLAGRARITCTLHNIPPAMLGAANTAIGSQ